jgi:hypothetical protein
MNPYHSNCPICRKLGITVDTTHYIHCPAYRDMVHRSIAQVANTINTSFPATGAGTEEAVEIAPATKNRTRLLSG